MHMWMVGREPHSVLSFFWLRVKSARKPQCSGCLLDWACWDVYNTTVLNPRFHARFYSGIQRVTRIISTITMHTLTRRGHRGNYGSWWRQQSLFLAYFPYFEKKIYAYEITMLSVCSLLIPFECLNASLCNWYVYHGNWAHINGIFHKSLTSVCVFVCVSLPSLLGNGSVKTLPRQRIHTQELKNCWTCCYLCDTCHIKGKREISSSQSVKCKYNVHGTF
jgi:hypothetical protein